MSEMDTRTSAMLDKKYWEFFVPTILMAMTLTMSIVVDSIIVGNLLGAEALAAVNLVMPVVLAYNTVAVCLGLGAATVISVAKGRRQDQYVNIVFTVALLTMTFLGLLLLAGQILCVDLMAKMLTSEPSLYPLVEAYLRVLVCGTPLIIIVPGLAYCMRVDGWVKLAAAILIIANLVNLALDLVYMGPLKMGIAGSSLATVSGYTVGALFLVPYMLSRGRTLRLDFSGLVPVGTLLQHIRTILKTGFPAAMGSILITIKILCINHIVLAVAGKSGMVAFSVCISCLSFVSMFISGAAQAMTPLVGVLYGETDFQGVQFVVSRAVKTLLITSLAVTVLLVVSPELVLRLFGIHLATDLAEGIPAIRIFSLSLLGTSITFLSMFYYMTIGRTKLSTAIAFVQGFSVVPFAFVLSRFVGVSGVWIAFSLAEVTTILMVAIWYSSLKRKFPHKYVSPLLLDQEQLSPGEKLELTSLGSPEAIGKNSQRLAVFLESIGTGQLVVETIRSTVEIAANTIVQKAYPRDKRVQLDIRMDATADAIVIALRDGGGPFSLKNDNSGMYELEYSRTIGFNNHTFTFNPAQLTTQPAT